MSPDPKPRGILGGERSVRAYMFFAGVETVEELEQEQLILDLGAAFTSSSTSGAKSPSTSFDHVVNTSARSGRR
jgi:hypothetical protein